MPNVSISNLPAREQFVFHHFWNLLSLLSAVAQWGLWMWLLDGRVPALPWWAHVVTVLGLAFLYRTAARVLEQSTEPGPRANALGQAVLASGFVAVMTMTGVLTMAGVWWGLGLMAQGFNTPAAAAMTLAPPALGLVPFRPIGDAIIAASIALHTWGYAFGFRRLRVREFPVVVDRLPAAFDGYRILHVSDIHLGPLCHRDTLRAAFARARTLAPDLVCVTGDVVDTPNCDLDFWIPELRALTAPDGVLAILGNHDRHSGTTRVAGALASTHWRLLRNECATIRRGDAALHLLGVEDDNYDESVAALDRVAASRPDEAVAIALIHHPILFDRTAALGIPLTLAGHTHGGQLALPFAPRVNIARLLGIPRDFGFFTEGRSLLHVSRGLGTSGQRVRVGAPRELTVLRLVRA